jgi:hypothetical protein
MNDDVTRGMAAVAERVGELQREREVFRAAFLNLHAIMKGECPGLLDSDRDGDLTTDHMNSDALALDAELRGSAGNAGVDSARADRSKGGA